MVSPEAGYGYGAPVSPYLGVLYAARIFSAEDTKLVRHGIGGAGSLLIDVAELSSDGGAIQLGPRVQAEYLFGEEGVGRRGLFGASLVARWVLFGTTRKAITF
jgi:hypothetical protein